MQGTGEAVPSSDLFSAGQNLAYHIVFWRGKGAIKLSYSTICGLPQCGGIPRWHGASVAGSVPLPSLPIAQGIEPRKRGMARVLLHSSNHQQPEWPLAQLRAALRGLLVVSGKENSQNDVKLKLPQNPIHTICIWSATPSHQEPHNTLVPSLRGWGQF